MLVSSKSGSANTSPQGLRRSVHISYMWSDSNSGTKVPKQPNFCDCGVYLVHFVETFLNDPEKLVEYMVCVNWSIF